MKSWPRVRKAFKNQDQERLGSS